MTFQAAAAGDDARRRGDQDETQTIARGPVAALVAIKQAGTNGGGFFGPELDPPVREPDPLEQPALDRLDRRAADGLDRDGRADAQEHEARGGDLRRDARAPGRRGRRRRLGRGPAERRDRRACRWSRAPNMEGKEVRFGPVASATWAAMTTATSNGSVNSMHDSLNPIAGMVPMSMMMLNVVFSGVGAGFENMLMYIIVAVFLAGLMVGRTPEYLGKKVEAKEVKLAMLADPDPPAPDLRRGGAVRGDASGAQTTVANPGPHGFSEILYEFTSAAANNGSGFEGLGDNNPAWNIATGIVLLLGRFPALILPLAVAGFLSQKKRVPADDRARCGPTT